jgi:hypothetical protein
MTSTIIMWIGKIAIFFQSSTVELFFFGAEAGATGSKTLVNCI